MPFPATACLVQHKLGANARGAFDLEAACSGFIYGLEVAQNLSCRHTYDTVWSSARKNFPRLWIGLTATRAFVWRWRRRGHFAKSRKFTWFADAVMALTRKRRFAFHAWRCSRCPATKDSVDARCITCAWRQGTFISAVSDVLGAQEVLQRCELDISQIKCVIPHQQIGESLCSRRTAWREAEQLFVNLHRYAIRRRQSVAIALDEAVAAGKFSAAILF